MNSRLRPLRAVRFLDLGFRRQEGIVLFIALIALVALSLAGVAFMRSVDTAGLLAGNLAFNRAAIAISDAGMEEARVQLATLDNQLIAGNCGMGVNASCLWMNGATMVVSNAPLTGPPASTGYYAWADPAFNYRTHDWTNAFQFNAAQVGMTQTQRDALTGYDVRYVIHRMCELSWNPAILGQTGEPRISNCLTTASTGGQSMGAINVASNQAQAIPSVPLYRVTLRVEGPRNSLAYVQVWMN
ncbi:MAG TPA: hypothetical protein VJ001_17150 [Rhodocyclaceae bacterium]|nr:hypothetical protein [Rhodocyclaceae bacterium]